MKSSIRQLALATGANYNQLLKASKKPLPGQVYDPDNVNKDAVYAVLINRHQKYQLAYAESPEEAKRIFGDSLVATYIELLDWEGLDDYVHDRDPSETHLASHNYNPQPVQVSDRVEYRGIEYECVYRTVSHLVLSTPTTTRPRVIAHHTFRQGGGRILINEENT